MKFKRFILIGLILGAGLLGWPMARQLYAQSLLEKLRPPSADQVKKWAGFPDDSHLTLLTQIPDDLKSNFTNEDNPFGKFKLLWAYEDRKGSNFARVVIAVFKPGGFMTAKRSSAIKMSEQFSKLYTDQKQLGKKGSPDNEVEIFERELSPMIMPNGQKSYGFGLLFPFPGRFAMHQEFDVFACEYGMPISIDESRPPADLVKGGTNIFSACFTNVDAFLTTQ